MKTQQIIETILWLLYQITPSSDEDDINIKKAQALLIELLELLK